MNPGSLASAAGSTASSAAGSAASSASSAANSAANNAASTASKAGSQATSQAASQAAPKPSTGSNLDGSVASDTPKTSSTDLDSGSSISDSTPSSGDTPKESGNSDLGSVDETPSSSNQGGGESQSPQDDSFDTLESEGAEGAEDNGKSWEDDLKEELENMEEEESEEDEDGGLEPGDKVDFGKQIGEDGQVEDTNMKKTLDAAAKAAIIIGSEGSASGAAKAIVDNPASSKLIGVVSDVAEKSPALKATADVLAETGVSDLVNDASDIVADAANGDVLGALKDADKAVKNLSKNEEKIKKKVISIIISVSSCIMAFLFIFLILFGPTLGGVMWITDKLKDIYNAVTETISSALDPEWLIDDVTIQTLLDEIPGYNDLSEERQSILSTAVLLVGTSYNMGGKPTGPGIEGVPASGLDCSGYVEWVMWTALGTPASSSGTAFYTQAGAPYRRINKEDLLPGDIAVLREGGSNMSTGDYNHVGIYAGNEMWFHAAGSSSGIVRGTSDSLSDRDSIFLRRTDIP